MSLPEKQASCWAVIPARKGSRGIPLKNLEEINGRSLIAIATAKAKAASLIDRVIVSSDGPRILEEAERFGATTLIRPDHLCSDDSSSESCLLHALEVLGAADKLPEVLVFLQCTAPFMHTADIDSTVGALLEQGADCAFAAARSHQFMWKTESSGIATPVSHDATKRLPRQQLEPHYIEAGSVYAMRTSGFSAHKSRFFGKTVIHEIPRQRVFEIDEPSDLIIARGLYQYLEEDG